MLTFDESSGTTNYVSRHANQLCGIINYSCATCNAVSVVITPMYAHCRSYFSLYLKNT